MKPADEARIAARLAQLMAMICVQNTGIEELHAGTALRNTLIEKGVLLEEGDFLIFTSDYSFTSASAAAANVIGASANGRILWKLPDGRTYADWETSQDVTNGTSS